METEYTRDIIGASAIFSTFAMLWFGWAQENAPKSARAILGLSSTLGALLAGYGFYVLLKNWDLPTRLVGTLPLFFGFIFVLEALLIALGATFLAKRKKSKWIVSWAS